MSGRSESPLSSLHPPFIRIHIHTTSTLHVRIKYMRRFTTVAEALPRSPAAACASSGLMVCYGIVFPLRPACPVAVAQLLWPAGSRALNPGRRRPGSSHNRLFQRDRHSPDPCRQPRRLLSTGYSSSSRTAPHLYNCVGMVVGMSLERKPTRVLAW